VAKVVFPDSYLSVTDGEREITSSASNYRELEMELIARWPDLAELLERTAVAIDGQIFQDALLEPIGPNSEVFFMARIEGG
jgi:hypothetical protein